jgi:hypothetical protein
MFGIDGVYCCGSNHGIDFEPSKEVNLYQIKCGSDVAKVWVSHKGQVGCVYRRLSIIDLDHRSIQ